MDEKVLQIVKVKGPVLPITITKDLKTNTIFAAAQLSTLVDKKRLKITKVKKGGSPFYYAEGQEQKLENLSEFLNKKDQQTFSLLKEKKILKDSEQTPLVRAGLRTIKDYAKPLHVTFNGKKELFWKYYLLPDEEATQLLKEKVGAIKKVEPKKVEIKEEKPEVVEVVKEIPKTAPKTEVKKETKPEEHKPNVEEKPIEKIEEKKLEKQEKIIEVKEEKPEKKVKEKPKDKFLEKIEKHFESKNIEIKDHEILKKNTEIELIIRVPSAVGTSLYYCKAKNKKKITDGDLSTAYIKGQKRQMPTLFLTPGVLNKEAEKMLDNEFKDELTLQKI